MEPTTPRLAQTLAADWVRPSARASPNCSLCLRGDSTSDLNHLTFLDNRRNCIHGKTESLPFVVTATQGTDAFDAKLVEGHCRFGSSSLTGAGAEQNDVSIT